MYKFARQQSHNLVKTLIMCLTKPKLHPNYNCNYPGSHQRASKHNRIIQSIRQSNYFHLFRLLSLLSAVESELRDLIKIIYSKLKSPTRTCQ